MTKRPNILFVLTDDHAAPAISAYGSVVNETPYIDLIAEQGVLFTRALVTNSLCTPSRATYLTGTHSHVNQVTTLSTLALTLFGGHLVREDVQHEETASGVFAGVQG